MLCKNILDLACSALGMYFGRSQINLITIKHLLLDNHLDCKTQLECGLVFDISGCNCCGLLYGINLYNDIDHIQRSVLRNIKLFKTNMKPSYWLISPFQYIRKLCHWFLGKCCIQSLPSWMYSINFSTQSLPRYILGIRSISMCKCAVYTSTKQCILYVLTFLLSLHWIHLLSIVFINLL